jgi:hypothetical protein
MADGSRIRVSLVSENTYGVTPNTPAMLVLPVTGAALADRLGYVQSNVINPDRNVDDLVRLSKSAGGTIPLELRFSPAAQGLDVALTGLLCSTWTAATTQVTGVTSSSGVLSAASIETGIESGDIVRVLTSADVLVGYYRVNTVGTGSITLYDTSVTGGTGLKVLRGRRMKNGTTSPSFSIEVAHLDLQKAIVYTGCVINTMDLNLAVGQLATITFGIEAQSSVKYENNTGSTDQFITGSTFTAATTHPTLDPIGVQEIRVGGNDYAAQSLTLNLTNNARPREQIGALGPVSMARGFFGATGSATAYLENWTDHTAFAGNTATDLYFAALDANSRGYSLALPQVKFSDVTSPVQGNNTDVFKNVSVTAYKDPTEACTVRLQMWA